MESHVKFRWVLLIALGFWSFTVACWAAGLTEPGVFTFSSTLAILIMVVVIMGPMAVSRLARLHWFLPAFGIWVGIALPAFNVANIWLFGIGQRCMRVSIGAGLAGLVALNVLWISVRHRIRPLSSEVPSNSLRAFDSPVRNAAVVAT